MNYYITNKVKIHRYLTILLLCCFSLAIWAGPFSFFKKKKKEDKKEIKKTPYERALTDNRTMSSRGTFISLHKTQDKLLLELPKSSLGRDMLLGSTITSISNPQLGEVGFKNSSLVHIRFVEKDSFVVMQAVNSDFYYNPKNNKAKREAALNYNNLDFYSFPILGHSKEGTVLFDASSFFTKETRFFPVIGSSVSGLRVVSSLQESTSRITALKTFDTNACIKLDRNYLISINTESGKSLLKNYPVTIGVNFVIALLPKEKMVPRLSDTRLGNFLIEKDVERDNGIIERASFVKRWRIEPKDTAAYFAGQLCEPKKPIVFYVDNTFPKLWRKAIYKAVLRWNDAFEKIGFKNVMQVRDFPTDDPEFDPDNFKYSCIRYLPTKVENAMGPSWVDPRTGEIINATVLVYNDVVNTIDNWRFVQTAQVDPAARCAHMPDSIKAETIEYILAHEVGHTLGFMHNMAASAAIPTDSLRSVSFTTKYGTTASIMDYARFNYVAQPGDKGVKLTPPHLGVYDYYIVDWTYRLFPNSKGFEDDNKRLRKMVESHEGDPFYRYGLQQTSSRYDPSAIEEDLSNDPIKASNYGLKNIKYILDNMDKWMPNDSDNERKDELYQEALNQAMGYLTNVYANIWGIYLYNTSEKSGLPRYKVVPKEQQRASALWLLKHARNFASLANANLERKLPKASNHPFALMAKQLQALSMRATAKLSTSYYLDSTSYSPLEYCEDVFQDVFGKTIANKENLSSTDLDMQDMYVSYLKSGVQDVKQVTNVHNLQDKNNDVAFLNFGKDYGEPEHLWGLTISRTQEFMLYYAQKLYQLLKQRIKTTHNSELKVHYMLLERKLQSYLD